MPWVKSALDSQMQKNNDPSLFKSIYTTAKVGPDPSKNWSGPENFGNEAVEL